MRQITFRLKPGQFLREEIEKKAKENKIKAGVLLSIVGGVKNVKLRMSGSKPDNQIIKDWKKPFEIVSGTGTISNEGCHIHIAVSDQEGSVFGGHLKERCIVAYTAEIVLGIFDGTTFKRAYDEETGYNELKIS